MTSRPRKTYTLTPEHRARLLENLRKARAAPRRPHPPTPRQKAAFRANLAKARAILRERGWPHSERQRAAARANIQKAQAAIRERGLPATPRRRAANLGNLAKANAVLRTANYPRNQRQRQAASANLRKARAVSHDPKNYAHTYGKLLKHGLYVRSLDATLELLGESPREYQAHLDLLARSLCPQNEAEQRIVRRLGQALWRRLRFYRAQALWEGETLKATLQTLGLRRRLTPAQTRARAYAIMEALLTPRPLLDVQFRLLSKVERELRALLRLRVGGDPKFKIFARDFRRTRREIIEEAEGDDFMNRLVAGDPEAVQRVRDAMPESWRRTLGEARPEEEGQGRA